MPWCEPCAKYWTPTAMGADGRCPRCGEDIEAVEVKANERLGEERTPWHFKLLVVALVAYLGWRFIEIFI
jgi:hypothetical protein